MAAAGDGRGDGDGADEYGQILMLAFSRWVELGHYFVSGRNVVAWIIKDKKQKNSKLYLKGHQPSAENHSSRLMHPSRKILDNSSIPIFSP